MSKSFTAALSEAATRNGITLTLNPDPDVEVRRTRLGRIRQGQRIAWKGMTDWRTVTMIFPVHDGRAVEVLLDGDTEFHLFDPDTLVDVVQ